VLPEALERLGPGCIAQAEVAQDRPGESLPDPKDRVAVIEAHRQAAEFASRREYEKAIDLFRAILRGIPDMKDVGLQLGVELMRAGRLQESLDAFKRLVALDPRDGNGLVSSASVLFRMGRLDDAAAHARTAVEVMRGGDARRLAAAYEVLVRVALARRDFDGARRDAALAQQADPSLPLPTYVEALILHGEGRYSEALQLFQTTIKRLEGQSITIQDPYYYTGDTRTTGGGHAGRGCVQDRDATVAGKHEGARGPGDDLPGRRTTRRGRGAIRVMLRTCPR
jgi:tetratricopeptide (TPR) repeat protein